jgi:hypothetical protein
MQRIRASTEEGFAGPRNVRPPRRLRSGLPPPVPYHCIRRRQAQRIPDASLLEAGIDLCTIATVRFTLQNRRCPVAQKARDTEARLTPPLEAHLTVPSGACGESATREYRRRSISRRSDSAQIPGRAEAGAVRGLSASLCVSGADVQNSARPARFVTSPPRYVRKIGPCGAARVRRSVDPRTTYASQPRNRRAGALGTHAEARK